MRLNRQTFLKKSQDIKVQYEQHFSSNVSKTKTITHFIAQCTILMATVSKGSISPTKFEEKHL